MIGLVDLALPCRLISLKVKLGPERGVTTLEDLVAKAILAGRTSVERQAELFGLPRRLLLDVVISLWGKGYVTIDMESGEIRLSDSAHDILIGGGTLQEASAEVQDRQFLFEPITGRVLSPRQGMQHPPGGTLQVPLHHGIDESDLPQDELVRAVQAAIRQDRREGFRKSVLGVNFGNPVLRPPRRAGFLLPPALPSNRIQSGLSSRLQMPGIGTCGLVRGCGSTWPNWPMPSQGIPSCSNFAGVPMCDSSPRKAHARCPTDSLLWSPALTICRRLRSPSTKKT